MLVLRLANLCVQYLYYHRMSYPFLSGQGDLEPDEDPMENFEDPEYDETLFDKIPEDFRDFTLEKIVRTPIHLENFRQFLQVISLLSENVARFYR